ERRLDGPAGVRAAVREVASQGPLAAGRALDAAGWSALDDIEGPLAALFAAKRSASRALLTSVRDALNTVSGPRRRLEPQAFPPPFHRISGFPLGELGGVVERIGNKLYTMHWPMIARYWARDLVGDASLTELDAVTSAIALRFGLTDRLVDGAVLRYPEPDDAHPVGQRVQREKLATAKTVAGRVPITAFVHSYAPLADGVARFDLPAASGHPLWINRYGYLSDAKLAAIAS